MGKDVIVACDFSSAEQLYSFLAKFENRMPFLKIGMELFYKEGPALVKEIKARGAKIFLDLKLHDIPNTVHKAMRNIARLGADITNLHAAGGIEMMRAALKGLEEGSTGDTRPQLIAVTQLTSISADILKNELLINTPLPQTVEQYALNAKTAGLDGVVCSPLEAPLIKELGLISVTPGIRLAGDDKGDQKRVTTPAKARELGSTYIVVGRSITGAKNPEAAYDVCMRDFCG